MTTKDMYKEIYMRRKAGTQSHPRRKYVGHRTNAMKIHTNHTKAKWYEISLMKTMMEDEIEQRDIIGEATKE